MDVSNQIKQIETAFGWSCGVVEQKPAPGWNSALKKDPNLIDAVKAIIKTADYKGEMLEIFYWWMGVTLDLIPADLRKKAA